jgi:hypothetical protein
MQSMGIAAWGHALRRWWWVPVVAGLVGLALGVTVGGDGGGDSTATASVSLTDDADYQVIPTWAEVPELHPLTEQALAEILTSSPAAEAVGKSAGASITVTERDTIEGLDIRVSAASVDEATSTLDDYVAYLTEIRQREADAAAAAALAVFEEARVSIDTRLAEIANEVDAADPGSGRSQRLIAEVDALMEEQVRMDNATTGLAGEMDPGVTVIDQDTSSPVSSRSIALLLGIAFAGLAAAVVVLTADDRTLRTRRDVIRTIGAGTEVYLSDRTSTAGLLELARAIERLAPPAVQLVPVVGSAGELADEVNHTVGEVVTAGRADGVRAVAVEPLTSSTAALTCPAGTASLVVVTAGSTRREDLALTVSRLRQSGANVAGVVLVVKGAKGLARASR